MAITKTQLVQDLSKFLEEKPDKHLSRVQKAQLLIFDMYYCIKCRSIMSEDNFEKDSTKETGLCSSCNTCSNSAGADISQYIPPNELLQDPEALARWFNDLIRKAKKNGFDRKPRALGNMVRNRYKQLDYCGKCSRYHPVDE